MPLSSAPGVSLDVGTGVGAIQAFSVIATTTGGATCAGSNLKQAGDLTTAISIGTWRNLQNITTQTGTTLQTFQRIA